MNAVKTLGIQRLLKQTGEFRGTSQIPRASLWVSAHEASPPT